MYILQRSLRFVRGALLSYGPSSVKKLFWDKEFSSGKWNFIDNTAGDCVYAHLEKHTKNGKILDLGCGPGNTANELAETAYRTYVGVDISEAALAKARRRTEENGRASKNRFEQGDFLSYVPSQQFEVILFREAMYHVPLGEVRAVLNRYSQYLSDTGVFIVRMRLIDLENGKSKYRPMAMMDIMERDFNVVEKSHYTDSGGTVIVFRPKNETTGPDDLGEAIVGGKISNRNG
jgi:2-polyprenyl-3-methyl-5-hydroxy-6-metoxy-1,4-benzoquinol methylase